MKGEKICQHKKESGDPPAIKVGMIFIWHLLQWPGQRCDLRHLAAYRWYYTVANSQMPYLWHRTEESDLTKLSGQRWKLNIGYINVRLCIQEKIIQAMPNNVYFRKINYTLVESWMHHWQLHEKVHVNNSQKTWQNVGHVRKDTENKREDVILLIQKIALCPHLHYLAQSCLQVSRRM